MAFWSSLFKAVAPSVVGGLFDLGGAKVSSSWSAADQRRAQLEEQAFTRESWNRSEAFQREMASRNEALQREFSQMGIRWRVQDAKAAGLHPLYAMGQTGISYSPASVIGAQPGPSGVSRRSNDMGAALGRMGQNVARAAMAQVTGEEQQLFTARLTESRAAAQKDFAQASYYDALAAAAGQPKVFPYPDSPMAKPIPLSGTGLPVSSIVGKTGVTKSVPTEVARAGINASQTGGSRPMWTEYVVRTHKGSSVKMLLPSDHAAQALESASESHVLMGAIIAHNTAVYGPEWVRKMGIKQSGFSRAYDVLNVKNQGRGRGASRR